MPFKVSACMLGGNLDNNIQKRIMDFLSIVDDNISILAQNSGLSRKDIRQMYPLNLCVLVNDSEIFIVVTNIDVGGLPIHQFIDWSGKSMNMQMAVSLVERDLLFKNPFGFSFNRDILNYDKNQQTSEAIKIANVCIENEIINLERLNKMVKINPIFNGRDFLINEKLIFYIGPFEEPFNTIYNDHVKNVTESINNFKCIRADDIYDNKPIIEDIWKSINEAKIIISELTGRNPNVFYETGISHTVGKEVIIITQDINDIPFDLRHLRCIIYEYTPKGMKIFEDNLKNTISNILSRK